MIKTLFKKQLAEVFSWLYIDKKTGEAKKGGALTRSIILNVVLFAVLGVVFFFIAAAMAPIIQVGYGWLFFALMGIIAITIGVIGSVFNTYASLYQAKDNNLLLSMPIPPRSIIFVRLLGVLSVGFVYEMTILIPTLIVWFMNVSLNPAVIICSIVVVLMISLFVLTLSAILGWIVALISSKMKRKNITSVIVSVVFLLVYFAFTSQSTQYLTGIVSNPEGVGDVVKSAFYPFYQMGLAAEGNVVSTLIFAACICVLFAIIYFLISRNFLKLATANVGAEKVDYKAGRTVQRSAQRALLGKELRRFTGSSTYMLNCGMGLIMFPVAAVYFAFQREELTEIMTSLFGDSSELVALLAAGIICFICSMVAISAPSVSLEGKNIWLVQSLPVSSASVLMAKLKLHFILTIVPAIAVTVVMLILVQPAALWYAVMPLMALVFTFFSAAFGLALNLKWPNLTWADESVPVKKSTSVNIAVLGGMAIVAAAGFGYYLLKDILSPDIYSLIVSVVIGIVAIVLTRWIKTKGARIFELL